MSGQAKMFSVEGAGIRGIQCTACPLNRNKELRDQEAMRPVPDGPQSCMRLGAGSTQQYDVECA